MQTFHVFLNNFLRVYLIILSIRRRQPNCYYYCQGSRSIHTYRLSRCVHSWIMVERSSWDEKTLQSTFVNFLNDQVKDKLFTREIYTDFDKLINFSIRIGNCIWKRQQERNYKSHQTSKFWSFPFPPPYNSPKRWEPEPELEPMQVRCTRLTPEERHWCMEATECICCGKIGHYITNYSASFKGYSHQ